MSNGTNSSNFTNYTVFALLDTSSELPSAGAGTTACIIGGALFLIGFVATAVIYCLNYSLQQEMREKRRLLNNSAAMSPSSEGSPMSPRAAQSILFQDDDSEEDELRLVKLGNVSSGKKLAQSRSSTPDFQPAPSTLGSGGHSFRVPPNGVVSAPPVLPLTTQRDSVTSSLAENKSQSAYFVDSDEELIESTSRRGRNAPLVGGSRVHVKSVRQENYFAD